MILNTLHYSLVVDFHDCFCAGRFDYQKWRLIGDIGVVCDFASNHWLPNNLLHSTPDVLLHDLFEGSPEGSHGGSHGGSHYSSHDGSYDGSLGCSPGGMHNVLLGRSYHFPPESLPDPTGDKKGFHNFSEGNR